MHFTLDSNAILIKMKRSVKLMYGCTHVIMIDGYYECVVGHAAIQVKNSILIYKFIVNPALQKLNICGIWEHVRMDHDQEFSLVSLFKISSHPIDSLEQAKLIVRQHQQRISNKA